MRGPEGEMHAMTKRISHCPRNKKSKRVKPLAGDYLSDLNLEQRRAVEHGVVSANNSPLLVIAGAGSGKTKTLSHRVAHLVVKGMGPRRILLLTFSRHAAEEMTDR